MSLLQKMKVYTATLYHEIDFKWNLLKVINNITNVYNKKTPFV